MAAAASVRDEPDTVNVVLSDKTRVAAERAAAARATSLPELMQTLLYEHLVRTGRLHNGDRLTDVA